MPKRPNLHALQVTVICGEDLLAVDSNGKSDPFCELQLLDEYDQPVFGKKRTRTKSKTLNPKWDQTVTLKLPKDPKAPRTPLVVGHKVRVQVKDRDAGGIFSSGVVTNLGQCTLSLALLKPGVPQEQWYKLERVGEMQRVEGRIRVKWYREQDPESPTKSQSTTTVVEALPEVEVAGPVEAKETEEQKAEREAELAELGVPAGTELRVRDPAPFLPPNELTVILMKASSLKVMDRKLFGQGSSDPYVRLSCEGDMHKSTTKTKDLEPTWEEVFTFAAFDERASLELQMYDHDDIGLAAASFESPRRRRHTRARAGSDDFMGSVDVPLASLRDKKLVRRSLQIKDAKNNEAGTVDVFLCWRTSPHNVAKLPNEVHELVQGQEKYKSQALNELIVCPIRATRLIGVDSHLGGGPKTSDPYVICSVDGLQMKTSHKSKTCRPEWLEVLKIPVDGYARASLAVEVWDHNLGKDVFLGKCCVDLAKYEDRKGRRRWRTLTDEKGMLDKDRGRIELHIVWRHNTTLKIEIPRDLEDDTLAAVDETLVPPTELQVFVARAKGLTKECDPYLRVECEAHIAETLSRSKTNKPVWKDTLVLGPVEGDDECVVLSLYDKKPKGTRDKLIGTIEVPLVLLRNKCPVRRWLPINGTLSQQEIARCLAIDTKTRGNEDREALALAKRGDCYYSSDDSSDDDVSEDPSERLDRAKRKVRESLKALDKAEALPEDTAEEEVCKIEAINEAEALHDDSLAEEQAAQALYDDDETLTAQCSAEEQEQVREHSREHRLTIAESGEALGVFTAKIFDRWVSELIDARPPPPDPNAPIAHEASPFEYADWTPPSQHLGSVDVWFAWRHEPKHFYKVPRSLEEDFYPERVANEATVCVIRAKKLLSVQKDKDAADVMVSLNLRGNDKQKHTRVIQKTLWPLWGQAFYLPALDATSIVECTVQDVDDPGPYQTLEFMGRTSVELQPFLDEQNRGKRLWYSLCDKKGKEDNKRGILELYVAYRHNVDLAIIDVPEESAVDNYKQQDANELVIVLVRARHLGKRGTPPDQGPLSKVRITSGSWAPTTSTEKRGISPLWLETFRIECEDFEEVIRFEVLENDEVLGHTTLEVKTLAGRKPIRKWFKLDGLGDLDLCLHWHHSPDVKIAPLSLETQPSADRRLPLNSLVVTVLRCRGLRRQDLEKRGPVGRGRVRKSRMNEDEEPVEVRPANPRVRMEIGNLPHLSTDKYTEGEARQVTNTFNPNYMETFRFDDVYDGGLIARIYVEHTGQRKPEMMGKCAVPVKALSHRRALRRWLTLEDKKGRADPTLGRIEVCLRWCHNPELEVELAEEGARDPHMSKQPNELFVVLIRARNLKPQSRKHDQSKQADPFVVLSCAGKETRSTTRKKTLNPRWVERYTWDADDATDVLDIEVRDACAYTGHDFLGRVGVEMDQLRKRHALRKFLTLKNEEDYRDDERGEIELLLHWRHNPHFTPKRFPEESDSYDKAGKPNCLVVVLVRAKKLKRLEKYAETPGTTDPTCMLTLDGEKKRSRTVENQLNPHWNQSFKFNDIEDLKLDRDTQHFLEVDIFDTDDDGEVSSIASCRVPCFKFRDRKPHRTWHWLSREGDQDAQSAGKVELVIRWVHDPSLILPVELDNVYEDEGSEVQQPNEITIHVVRCRQLIRTSRTLASKDTSNPFVRVSTTFESKRTKTARRTVAPVYQKRFSFEGRQGDHDLLVEVFDSSSGDEEPLFMGRARLALKELRERKPVRKWLTLTDEYGRKDKRRGQVDVVCWHFYRGKYVVSIPNQVEDDPAVEGPCNQICICLVRAWNLPVRQHKSKDAVRAADPFCVLRCGEQERATQVEEGTVHPLYQEVYKFLAPEETEVRCDVWDYDGLRANSWVGSCTLKTCDIARDKDEEYRVWLPLRDEFGQINGSRGLVELYARWHTSLKLWSPATDVIEVAEGVTEERVYRPGKPTGIKPEQLVVIVRCINGLQNLRPGTAVYCRVKVRSQKFQTTPRRVTNHYSVYIQERCHFYVDGVEGPGIWDGPPVCVELYAAADASSKPDWCTVLAAYDVPIHQTYMKNDATVVQVSEDFSVEIFLRWRHLRDARTYEGSQRMKREEKKPKKGGFGLAKFLENAQQYGESDEESTVASSSESSHLAGYISEGHVSSSDEASYDDSEAVSVLIKVEAARGVPAPRFVQLEASVNVSCVDANNQDDLFEGSYATEKTQAVFESSHAVGAKFADLAFVSEERMVVSSSSILRFSLSAQGSIQERRYVSKKPLRCLGFCRMWLKGSRQRTFTKWLQINGGSLSSDEWTHDRGELKVTISVEGPADSDELIIDEPWRQEVEEVPPFGLEQLRDLPPLQHKHLTPLVLPETFVHTGGLGGIRKKNARAYREALSKLPLLDAQDEKAKRRLVEQHFMRVAGYAVASRILSKSLKANDLPPAGPRRFDGSGYFYPAGAPDPRRPRGAYPDTKASTLRYDASVAWRDKLADAKEKIDHSKPIADPGAKLWRCGRTFSLLPGKRKPGEELPTVS